MLITRVCQWVTPAVSRHSLDPEAMRTNHSDAGHGECSFDGCTFESLPLPRWNGKEQFIVFTARQSEVYRVKLSRGCIRSGGGRYRERTEVKLHSVMAFLTDVTEVAGEAVRNIDCGG